MRQSHSRARTSAAWRWPACWPRCAGEQPAAPDATTPRDGRRERRAAVRGGARGLQRLRSSRAGGGVPPVRFLAGPVGHHARQAAPAGTNVVEPLLGGCAIRENYLDPWGTSVGHEPQQLRRRHEAVAADVGGGLRHRLPDGGRASMPRARWCSRASGSTRLNGRLLFDTWKWTPRRCRHTCSRPDGYRAGDGQRQPVLQRGVSPGGRRCNPPPMVRRGCAMIRRTPTPTSSPGRGT